MKYQSIKISKETLEDLNELLKENPLLEQGENIYDDLIRVLIIRHLRGVKK